MNRDVNKLFDDTEHLKYVQWVHAKCPETQKDHLRLYCEFTVKMLFFSIDLINKKMLLKLRIYILLNNNLLNNRGGGYLLNYVIVM